MGVVPGVMVAAILAVEGHEHQAGRVEGRQAGRDRAQPEGDQAHRRRDAGRTPACRCSQAWRRSCGRYGPDLPMPLTTTRPSQARHSSQARTKRSSTLASRALTASASMPSARRAEAEQGVGPEGAKSVWGVDGADASRHFRAAFQHFRIYHRDRITPLPSRKSHRSESRASCPVDPRRPSRRRRPRRVRRQSPISLRASSRRTSRASVPSRVTSSSTRRSVS